MAQQTVVWSQKAQIKLFIILEFYTVRNGSPAYANKLYAKFKKELKTLFKQPETGILTDCKNVRALSLTNTYYSTKPLKIKPLCMPFGIADKTRKI
ncbi:MAG: hypothetical protein KKC03_02780 [Bacteroidetes bacterium]|nr:hypothetical protein [Bacteroidota bacterium]